MHQFLNKLKTIISSNATKKIDNKVTPQKKTNRDEHIKNIMNQTGWSREETIEKVKVAKERTGITYAEYDRFHFYDANNELMEEEYFARKWKEQQRKRCVSNTMEKSGWNLAYTKNQIKDARNRLGITYIDYDKYNFYCIPVDQQQEKYEQILKRKALRKQESRQRAISEKEHHIKTVMDATGWDRYLTLDLQRRCAIVAGCDFEHYAVYRLYEMSEEEQKKHFVARITKALRKRYNIDPEIIYLFRDKVQTCKLLSKYLGRPWISTVGMTFEQFEKCFRNEKKIIYKSIASYGGKGVEVFDLTKNSIKSVYTEISQMDDGIVEGFIKQHPEMAKLSVNSVNTIRVATVKTNKNIAGVEKDKLHFLYAGLRMGSGKSYVDNLHSGGLIGGIDLQTGVVITDGCDFSGDPVVLHPDTQVAIKDFKVPYFEEMKEMLQEASQVFKTGYFGWDIAISETGPVIIEVNTSPGSVIIEVPYIPQRKGMAHVAEKYCDPKDLEPVYVLKAEEKEYFEDIKRHTGWSSEEALSKVTDAYVRTGTSCKHYAIYRFWELEEEVQNTYFSIEDTNRLRARFNRHPDFSNMVLNKDLCNQFFEPYLGRPWMSTKNLNEDDFQKSFGQAGKIIYKPSSLSGGGGIQVFDINADTIHQVYKTIVQLPAGVIEGFIYQHPEMQKLSLSSVNTLRVVTVKTNQDMLNIEKDKVHFLYCAVRMGTGTSSVDNLHSGGLVAGVDLDSGIITTDAVDYEINGYEKHPDTQQRIKGFKIPHFDKVKKLIEEASSHISEAYLGWDIAIMEDGPVLIEVNCNPGITVLQSPYALEKKGMKHVIENYLK